MRLFVAVDLGEVVRDGVAGAIRRLSRKVPGAKWLRAENVHVTLVFLGHLPDERVPAIAAAVRAVAARHAPLELAVRGGGSFGSSRKPRVLWLGIDGDVAALGRVQQDLVAALVPLGLEPEEREFRPHLTLARAKDPRGDPALAPLAGTLANADLGTARIAELVLFESQLSPKGATHTALERAALSARR